MLLYKKCRAHHCSKENKEITVIKILIRNHFFVLLIKKNSQGFPKLFRIVSYFFLNKFRICKNERELKTTLLILSYS